MKTFCPNCFSEQEIHYITKTETLPVRDEPIEVESRIAVCDKCGTEIFDMGAEDENLKRAYTLYRQKRGLLMPLDIKAIREKYRLSQRALARILGWGLVTIQRYEQGALQDDLHDAVLRKVSEDPVFLFEQFQRNRGRFSQAEGERIERTLTGIAVDRRPLLAATAYEDAEHIAFVRDSASRGRRPFEQGRFSQVVARIAFAAPNLFKTKLAKLLWLCDFGFYAKTGQSITGLAYCRMSYGPAPDDYQLLLGFLESSGVIALTPYETDTWSGETVDLKKDPGADDLEDEELRWIDKVIFEYGRLSSSQLSDRSHEETIWKERSDGEHLPYSEAHRVRMVQTLIQNED